MCVSLSVTRWFWKLFLSGVGEQQWLQRTEQSIAACRCRTGLETRSFPAGVGVSLLYSPSSLFGSFFTPGGKWGHYDTLFPAGTHRRQVSMETKPRGTILKRQFVKQGVQILKEGGEKEFPYGLCDERRTHMCRGNVQGSTFTLNKNKHTKQQNTRMLLLSTAKSSRNHRSTEYPVSKKWGKHSGGRLWPFLGGASPWEWSMQRVTQGAGWRKLYTPAEGRPEGANLFLTWLLYCSKINSKENMLFLWMMDGTWSIVLVLNFGQRRILKYGSKKSILQQWWAKRKGSGKKTVF